MTNAETPLINPDAECGLLSYLMMYNDALERIPFIRAEHFGMPIHAHLFAESKAMIEAGKAANMMTLIDHLPPGIDREEGRKYLVKLQASALHLTNPEQQARHVVELAQRRALHQACMEAAAILTENPNEPPAETALQLADKFERVSRGFGMPMVVDDYTVTDQILDDLERKAEPFSTGLSRLDEAMGGGLYPGKAYGIGGRKKCGKTIIASTISCNLALQGVKHLFVCAEMSPKEIHQRNLARLTDCYPSAFRSGYGQSVDFARKLVRARQESLRCIRYYNAPGCTFDELRRVVVTEAVTQGIKGFFFDYWQLCGGKGRQNEREHLDEVAQWIATACRKYNLFAVVTAQINQDGNTRGGEGMRLAFDQVYHLQRKDVSEPYAFMEMMDTRYTSWMDVGTEDMPGLFMEEKGPWFRQV